jgi:hypothetical protein
MISESHLRLKGVRSIADNKDSREHMHEAEERVRGERGSGQ